MSCSLPSWLPACVTSYLRATPSKSEAAIITLDKDALGGTKVEFGDALEAPTLIHAYGYLHHLHRMEAKHRCSHAARTPLAFVHERASHALPTCYWCDCQQAHFRPTDANADPGI